MLKKKEGDCFFIFGKINDIDDFLKEESLLEQFTEIIIKYRNNDKFTINALYEEAKTYNNNQYYLLLLNMKTREIISMCRIGDGNVLNKSKTLILSLVVVNHVFRNSGYGTKMINYLLKLIKKNFSNFNKILLHVDNNNENAIKLYTKIGFVKNIEKDDDIEMQLNF
jgi:ribosomal protein S18 acetylase RimI-like enzyme